MIDYIENLTIQNLRKKNYFSSLLRFCVTLRFFFPVFIVFLPVSCSRQEQKDGLLIAVSIPPQQWFVSQIAGNNADTLALAGPGQNPHNYEPSPKQIQSLSSAKAWILSGSEFEISLRPKIAVLFPNLLIIDGTQGVNFRMLEEHDEDEHEHYFLEIDRHTWLGREPAKIMVTHIRDAFSHVDSANREYYHKQCEILVNLIDDEFNTLKIELAPLKGRSVFVYHPSFGYFLDEFGIYQEAVETGGKEPGPRTLNNLAAKLKKEQATALFVQTQFPVNAAKTLAAAAGVELIGLDPLAQDWLENIRRMGQALKKAAPNDAQ
jgi:zinc transport system substrate-binding protein